MKTEKEFIEERITWNKQKQIVRQYMIKEFQGRGKYKGYVVVDVRDGNFLRNFYSDILKREKEENDSEINLFHLNLKKWLAPGKKLILRTTCPKPIAAGYTILDEFLIS